MATGKYDIKPTGIYAFKWLDAQGCTSGGGSKYQWSLPKGNEPGEWHSKIKSKKPIVCCEHGFHCVPFVGINSYSSYGPRLFLVEIAGKFNCHADKLAVESIRLITELKTYKHGGAVEIIDRLIPCNTLHALKLSARGVVGRDIIGSVQIITNKEIYP